MRFPDRPLLALLALAPSALAACDDVTTGQPGEDKNPPILMKVLIQDELPSGGRRLATDLIDQSPTVSCSEKDPCPAGDKYSHPPCNLQTGICPNPLKPSETPPGIGIPGALGGNQIRLVFNKNLDPAMVVLLKDPMTGAISGFGLVDESIIGLYDDKGQEVQALKYWDGTGAPTVTSDVFINPFGPALVIKPKVGLGLLKSYEIRIKPEGMKDAGGRAVEKDVNGNPVAKTFPFTVETFCAAGGTLADLDSTVDPRDVLAIKTNVRFDPKAITVSVKKKDGTPVEIVAAPEYGTDAKQCGPTSENPLQLNVFHTRGRDRALWDEGDYLISVDLVAQDNRALNFWLTGAGKDRFHDRPFKVARGADHDQLWLAENRLLPSECALPGPGPDLAGTAWDLATIQPDLSTQPADMAQITDGGAGN